MMSAAPDIRVGDIVRVIDKYGDKHRAQGNDPLVTVTNVRRPLGSPVYDFEKPNPFGFSSRSENEVEFVCRPVDAFELYEKLRADDP